MEDIYNDISEWEVSQSDFTKDPKTETIKSGGNGVITFVLLKSNRMRCVKKKTMKSLKDKDTRRNFNREVFILGTYKHPALVPFVGFYENKNTGFIFLKAIEKGSLDNAIKNNNKDGTTKDPLWDDTHKLIIAYGTACAMEFLHSNNVIHRDLKPANILLDQNLNPYVTDFGTSKKVSQELSVQQTISTTTPIIMAPEFLEEPDAYKNSLPLDIYSYGVTLYHLISGMEPFGTKTSLMSLMSFVVKGGRPEIPDFVPDNWKELIQNCWAQIPTDRPSFSEICDVLESDTFNNDTIDKDIFNAYMKLVKPLRPGSPPGESKPESSPGLTKVVEEAIPDSKPEPKPEPKPETKQENNESPLLANLRKEFEKGTNVSSKLQYADALFSGKYGPPDPEQAYRIFLSVANNEKNKKEDKSFAEYYAGQCLVNQGKYEIASRFLNRAVCSGNADAAFYLAEQIFDGHIKSKNKDQLKFLYQLAADAGLPQAIKKFAFMNYYGSFDDHPDRATANKYFKIGSDNGDPELVYIWAVRNEFGRGCEKNVEEGMRLMKYAAEDLNYPEAQLDYGLHLYNGLNVPQDRDEAVRFFEKAGNAGNPTALLYTYLIFSNSSDEDEKNSAPALYEELFSTENAEKGNIDPDAWALNGQKLVDENNIDDALSNLFYAMSNGSIKAMLSLGKICENDPGRGDANFFYEQAANHCHCLDSLGTYTPIQYEVYHCYDCDINICEGCAKHCHKEHTCELTCSESAFQCKCGVNGFGEKCSAEFIGQQPCHQHLYQCQTCSAHNDLVFICKGCIEKCHKNHDIIDCGAQKNFCSCGLKNLPNNFKCKLLDYEQTEQCSVLTYFDQPVKQRFYKCIECGIYSTPDDGICEQCAYRCHNGHMLIDLGVQTRQCKCIIYQKCDF